MRKCTSILLILLFALTVSCSTTSVREIPPKLELKEIALADATLSDTIMIFRLLVENPHSETLKIDAIDYEIRINNILYHKGRQSSPLRVRPESQAEVEIQFKVTHSDVFDSQILALHDKLVNYRLSAIFHIGTMKLPLVREGRTPVIP